MNRSASEAAPASDAFGRRVFAAQVEMLYDLAPAGLLSSAVVVAVMTAVLAPAAPTRWLVSWLAVVVAVAAARYALVRAYRSAAPVPAEDAPDWARRFLVGTIVAGLAWSVGLVWLYPVHDIVKEAAVVVLLAGVCAGGLASLAPWTTAYAWFVASAGGPVVAYNAWLGGAERPFTSIAMAVFVALLVVVGRRASHTIAGACRLRFENDGLVAQLTAANAEIATVNVGLRGEVLQREHALEVAEQANRAKSTFLASMSHEIRTPLNSVLGMTQLLMSTPLTADQLRCAETAHRSAESLLSVIRDVLDFSKIEADRLELVERPFDVRQLVEDVCGQLAGMAQVKSLELVCSATSDVPEFVVGDSDRLRQILTNVVGNAVKFTARGEVEVRVSAAVASADAERFRLVVTVRDTGPGIAGSMAPRVFDAFSRADDSGSRVHTGSGLGLAIAKRLVERMRGTIGFTSEVGHGTEFRFTVEVGRATDLPRPVSVEILRGLRVLVVDDNLTHRERLRRQVSEWGASVEGVASAYEGLAALDQSPSSYDVALLDVQMPGMDGLQMAARVRADPRHDAVRLVVLSTVGRDVAPQILQAHRISRALTKPVRQSDLFDCLAEPLPRSGHVLAPAAGGLVASPARFDGLVLVAEDNEHNQQVAVAMLRRMGCEVDVVWNGREALSALEATRYDLVFMDCHMPVLDGFMATAAIRASESRRGRPRQPIVALVTDAMAGDADKSLSAGMDDYLATPFGLTDLRAVLDRWLARRAERA